MMTTKRGRKGEPPTIVEVPDEAPPPPQTEVEATVITAEYSVPEKIGRRSTDWVKRIVKLVLSQSTSILDIWKDERGHWSTRRLLLWGWTIFGMWLMHLEATARVYLVTKANGEQEVITPHFLNNAWIQAWMITEGALIVAVFGPVVADYLKNAAPALAAIGAAARDSLPAVVKERRDKAREAGSDGTEWTE
jgi:hypothetical protein